jgi:prevent-host-death family protein
MDRIGVRELRQNASVVLRRVAAGETVVITDRGQPVARLSPIVATGVAALREAGLVREPRTRMGDAPPPAPVPAGRPSAAQALAEARADER